MLFILKRRVTILFLLTFDVIIVNFLEAVHFMNWL